MRTENVGKRGRDSSLPSCDCISAQGHDCPTPSWRTEAISMCQVKVEPSPLSSKAPPSQALGHLCTPGSPCKGRDGGTFHVLPLTGSSATPISCQASPAPSDTNCQAPAIGPGCLRRGAVPLCKDTLHFTKEGIEGTVAVTDLSPVPESGFLISVKTF